MFPEIFPIDTIELKNSKQNLSLIPYIFEHLYMYEKEVLFLHKGIGLFDKNETKRTKSEGSVNNKLSF